MRRVAMCFVGLLIGVAPMFGAAYAAAGPTTAGPRSPVAGTYELFFRYDPSLRMGKKWNSFGLTLNRDGSGSTSTGEAGFWSISKRAFSLHLYNGFPAGMNFGETKNADGFSTRARPGSWSSDPTFYGTWYATKLD